MKKSSHILSVIGLGYVGLPLAIELSKEFIVIGYDNNLNRITSLKNLQDNNFEVSSSKIKKTINKTFFPTINFKEINKSDVIIITLPTPINKKNKPNIKKLKIVTEKIAKNIIKNKLIIYESTFYPGLIKTEFVPIFKKYNLTLNKDYSLGYSPERINPGDKKNNITSIKKIISASNKKSLKVMKEIYGSFVKPGLFVADSIEIAEAAKVIENTQRDVNIALINEFAKIFERMDISTSKVLEAAGTKWNFLKFQPGLVGGHCIGVDPYYLSFKAEKLGYKPKLILAGREINNNMHKFVFNKFKKILDHINKDLRSSNILLLGATFKENCPDTRNSQVFKLIETLKKKKTKLSVFDPYIKNNQDKVFKSYNQIKNSKFDLIAIIVPHTHFKTNKFFFINKLLKKDGAVFDFKNLFPKDNYYKI